MRIMVASALCLVCLSRLSALNVDITARELGLNVRGETNQTFTSCSDLALSGALEINDRFTFREGFAVGKLDNDTEIKLFTSGHAALLSIIPLYANFAYRYYSLPGENYQFFANSFLPSVSLNGRRAGITLGVNLRFTHFFDEPAIFEPALAFLTYVNVINNDSMRIGLSWANFSELYMGNMGAYFIKLDTVIRISERWSMLGAFELLQSGGDGLSSTFYGIAYGGGARYAW